MAEKAAEPTGFDQQALATSHRDSVTAIDGFRAAGRTSGATTGASARRVAQSAWCAVAQVASGA